MWKIPGRYGSAGVSVRLQQGTTVKSKRAASPGQKLSPGSRTQEHCSDWDQADE